MDKVELKKILKPLIKESIKEVLMEQGLINLVKESITEQPVISQKQTVLQRQKTPLQENLKEKARNEALENRKKMLQEIGRSGYVSGGFNPFANTAPIPDSGDMVNEVKIDPRGPLKDINPHDPGVDISGIMDIAAGKWKAHMGGKGK